VCKVLAAATLIAGATEVHGQNADTPPAQPSRTMAALLAEGYEMQRVRVFKDTIWMRKPSGGEAVAYVCDRGRIGSAVFESYRGGNYDQVPCSPVP